MGNRKIMDGQFKFLKELYKKGIFDKFICDGFYLDIKDFDWKQFVYFWVLEDFLYECFEMMFVYVFCCIVGQSFYVDNYGFCLIILDVYMYEFVGQFVDFGV